MLEQRRPLTVVNHTLSKLNIDHMWWEAFKVAWKTYLPVRIILSLFGAILVVINPGARWPPVVGVVGWTTRMLIDPWHAYDVGWYRMIAESGYGIPDGRAAFHPLLPLLMHVSGTIFGGNYVLGGLVVSNIACIATLAALYRLLVLDYDEQVARATIRWLLYAPTGFILLIPYTESLLLCFVVLAFWFSRKNRWLAAGLCGCLAALAKQPAIALIPALVWEYFKAHQGRPRSWRTIQVLASISLIAVGYVSYSLYRGLLLNEISTDGLNSFLRTLVVTKQLGQNWRTSYGWPWELADSIIQFMPRNDVVFWMRFLLVLGGLFLTVRALRYTRSSVVIFCAVQVAMISTIILDGDPLMGMPRRVMLMFPLFIALAKWTVKVNGRWLWYIVGLCYMIFNAILFSLEFVVP